MIRQAGLMSLTVALWAGVPCAAAGPVHHQLQVQIQPDAHTLQVMDRVSFREAVSADENGDYRLELAKGDTVTFCRRPIEETNFEVVPIPVDEAGRNLFGLNKKTERLPGHDYYYHRASR